MADRTRGSVPGFRETPLSGGSIREADRAVLTTADDVRAWLSGNHRPVPPSLQVLDVSAERRLVSDFYSGSAVRKAIDGSPPIIVSVSREDFMASFNPGLTVDGHVPDAIYVPGTNMIVFSADALSRYRPEVLSEMYCHEIIHYAGFIARGGENFSYMGQSQFQPGTVVPFSIEAHWLEEGFTNFFASRIGSSPVVPYPYETMTVRMLEMMGADRAMLVDAHSGNTQALQELVDRRLGPGAFEGLLRCRNGFEAMFYLLDRDTSGTVLDRGAILDDPIMREFFHPGEAFRAPTDPRGPINSPLERVRRH